MFLTKIGDYYHLMYRDSNGKRIKVTTKCKSKSDANSFLRSFKIQLADPHSSTTISVFANDYFRYASGVLTRHSLRTYKSAFNELLRIMGDVPIRSIGIREIEHFISIKCNESSPWSARRIFISLSAAFQKAMDWKIITDNPFKRIRKPKTPEILPAFLSPDDFKKLISIIPDIELQDLIYTALFTGLRLSELRYLKWEHIKFDEQCIIIKNTEQFTTKSKRIRIVPMSPELYERLLDRKQRIKFESDWVFYGRKGRQFDNGFTSKVFKKYVKQAGIDPKIHFHSLRHSFASALVKEGVSLYAVQKLLGHRSIKTTEIYSHLSPAQLHNEVKIGIKQFSS